MPRKILSKIFPTLFKDIPKPLGRWSVDKCNTSISMTNYYSNVDHCGTCDYEHLIIERMIRYKQITENNKKK